MLLNLRSLKQGQLVKLEGEGYILKKHRAKQIERLKRKGQTSLAKRKISQYMEN